MGGGRWPPGRSMRWQVDDDAARGLGVAVLRTRLLAFAAVAALTGAAVAIAGPVGFRRAGRPPLWRGPWSGRGTVRC